MPWDGIISDQDESPPDSPRAFLRANSRRASPAPSGRQQKAKGKASIKEALAKQAAAATVTEAKKDAGKGVAQNPLGAKWLDELSKKVKTSTQWIEPGPNRTGQPPHCASFSCAYTPPHLASLSLICCRSVPGLVKDFAGCGAGPSRSLKVKQGTCGSLIN